MKKELIISARFDTSDFDKSVESMQRKLKELYTPADSKKTAENLQTIGMGGVGGMSTQSMEAYKRSTQATRRELDQMISAEAKGQQQLVKFIETRTAKAKELQNLQKQLVKDSAEELKVKEQIARLEENTSRAREAYKQRDTQLNQLIGARQQATPQGMQRLMQAYQGGGIGGAMTAGGRMAAANPGAALGMVGSIMAGVGTIGQMGVDVYRGFGQAPISTQAASGNAIQGTLGRDVSNIYGRRTAFEQMWSPERAKAAQMALAQSRNAQNADLMSLPMGILKATGAGIAGGATAGGLGGAALGSLAGGVGAIPGAAAGALGGGILGGIGGFGSAIGGILTDPRKRALSLSPFSSTMANQYQSMVAEDLAGGYNTSLDAQKKMNPFKQQAISEYEQNFQNRLGSQRGLGLRNNDFYGPGGFLKQGIDAGFTPEMQQQMASGVLGAGGSTRAARGSVLGNQLERGFDMTNAAQIMGSISGGVGSSEATKQATIKILSEGMRLGLDDSKFAEENRRFTQVAAEVIGRSGAKGADDFERISGGMSRYLSENTTRGIEASKTAYEQYQQISSTTQGPRGVMRAAGFMRDPKLSQLSTMEKQAIMQIPEEQLNESNFLIQGAADKLGIDPKELVKKISNVNEGAVSRFGEADKLRDKIRGKLKDIGVEQVTDENFSKLPKDVQQDLYKLGTFQATELGYKGQREQQAFTFGTVGKVPGAEQYGPGGPGAAAVEGRLSGRETGRMEDNTIAAMAADAGTVLKNFNEMRGGMDAAAKSASQFTDKIREMNAELMRALEEGKGSKDLTAIENVLKKYMDQGGAENQAQGGKPSK